MEVMTRRLKKVKIIVGYIDEFIIYNKAIYTGEFAPANSMITDLEKIQE